MKNLLILCLSLAIFSVSWAQDLEPNETMALAKVKVVNNKNEVSTGDKVTFVAGKTEEEFSGVSDETGSFQILLPKADDYEVKFQSFGGFEDYAKLPIPDTNALVFFEFTIKYELPKVYKLENVYFASAKTYLKPESYPSLNNLAELLVNKKSLVIEVGGHTDDVGDEKYNQTLSQQRAQSVKNYLVKKGVDPERVKPVGYGESKPVVPNDTPEGRQQNRRTEVKILSN